MRILAIDYGEKRMGFAVGYSGTGSGFPLNPWLRKKIRHDLEHIETILAEYEIDKIILGLPINMDGSQSPMSRKVETFKKLLQEHTSVSIELVDERLTSFEAEEMLKPVIPDPGKRKKILDSAAAWVMLNRYLGET